MSRRTAEANKAIRLAWEREQALVSEGKGTRDWTKEQQQDILDPDKGKAYDDKGRAFEGQHMKSVAEYPEYQEHDVAASFTLDKSFTVTSTSENEEEIKQDLIEAYMTPLDLINELKKRLQRELKSDPYNKRIKKLIKECDGWTCDCDICVTN